MDVVALSEAGFGDSVAPLGTALTEDQIQIVWRMVPEPTLCFDGDSAGKRAAYRAIDTMLPHLKPGLSAYFAFLPDGMDPDDLIRREGTHAMQAVLERARPMAEVLWEREFATGDWSTPERRAQLEKQISGLVERIVDPAVRSHYGQAMRDRLVARVGAELEAPQEQVARRTGSAITLNITKVVLAGNTVANSADLAVRPLRGSAADGQPEPASERPCRGGCRTPAISRSASAADTCQPSVADRGSGRGNRGLEFTSGAIEPAP